MVPSQSLDSSFERILGGKKQKKKEEKETFSFDIDLVEYTEKVPAEYNWKLMVDTGSVGAMAINKKRYNVVCYE